MSLEIVHCMNCSLNVAKAADDTCPGCQQVISDQSTAMGGIAHDLADESANNRAHYSISIFFSFLITGGIYIWASSYGIQLGTIPLAIISSLSAAFVSMASTAIQSE